MKRQTYTLIAMIALVGLMAVAAQAQSNGRNRLTVQIPFAFNVGEKTMPAGNYSVSQVNPASDRVALLLRNEDGANVMLQMTVVIGRTTETARLVFRQYGSRYFFAEAWTDGDNNRLRASKSNAERAAHRELAGAKPKAAEVALKAR